MQLLELHIRNIASIERADIDFEHQSGLIDPDTGRPAQMFLIYGDTGTGKSVLLDAIAMALFKNTPRIDGVASRQHNSFTAKSGNEVKIYSIEQYTRIGISPKDECYSEVVFLGNDGLRYTARLELGINKNLKYKSAWNLKKENNDWEKIDKDGNMVVDIIGINFEQFCRMSMLAQGQFASFLCGERKERAEILEKLTNTTIFSSYGEAIKNIHDKKKAANASAESAYQSDLKFIISDEEVSQLQQQLSDASLTITNLTERQSTLNAQIDLLKKIEEADKSLSTSKDNLTRLHKIQQDESYLDRSKLISDWDSTDEERKAYTDLQQCLSGMNLATKEENSLSEQFASLSSSLLTKKEQAAKQEDELSALGSWLESRSHLDNFYNDARLTISMLDNYKQILNKITSSLQEKELVDSKKTELESKLKQAKDELDTATKEADDFQHSIDNLISQRNQLKPQENDNELNKLSKLQVAYDKLLTDINALGEEKNKILDLKNRLAELTIQKNEKVEIQLKDKNQYDSDLKAYEDARDRFTTINSSLDDKISELRRKMASENTEFCPLCGQKIANGLLTTEQFRDIISPFEEEQRRTKAAFEISQQKLDETNNQLNKIEGQITGQQKIINTQTIDIELKQKELDQRIAKANLDISLSLSEAIAIKQEQIKQSIEILQQKKETALHLQQQIDDKYKEKETIDKKKQKCNNDFLKAQGNYTLNDNKIKTLSNQITENQNNANQLEIQLNKTLAPWYGTKPIRWQDNIDVIVELLKSESEEYLKKKNDHSRLSVELNTEKENIYNMDNVRSSIIVNHPSWSSLQLQPLSSPITLNQWNELSQRSSANAEKQSTLRANINLCNSLLEGWQLTSGKSVDYLAKLIARREEVSSARSFIQDIEKQLTVSQQNANTSEQAIADARQKLSLSDDAPLPDLELLKNEVNRLKEDENNARELFSNANSKLKTNQENLDKVQRDEAAWQQAKKEFDHWAILNKRFGGDKFRNLVQTHILRPLLNNANIYLHQFSDRYTLTCSEDNEQLSILVLDRFNRDEIRSAAVLSGGEKFMISLALSLALSSLNRPDLNTNILFIDEGFGTLDQECLDSVMKTLGRLSDIAGQGERRVGLISHREELLSCIPNKIKLLRCGEGRSRVEVTYEA